MKQTITFGIATLLIPCILAVPVDRRNVVWVTDVEDVYETIYSVETVWVPWATTVDSAFSSATLATIPDVAAVTSTPAFQTPTRTSNPQIASASSAHGAPTSTSYIAAAVSSIATPPTTTEATTSTLDSSAPESSATSPEMSYGMASRGTTYTGDITYYATGLGSCGITSGYYDSIVAISHVIMDEYNPGNPNDNPLCGKQVMIQFNGLKFPATVVDRCTGCAQGDLDLSEGLFSRVTNGDTAAGRISDVTWSWT